ncbi:MAG: hypothetical protein QMD22_11185 [archaeon]|nr:hypothetical protein [archaeon]
MPFLIKCQICGYYYIAQSYRDAKAIMHYHYHFAPGTPRKKKHRDSEEFFSTLRLTNEEARFFKVLDQKALWRGLRATPI